MSDDLDRKLDQWASQPTPPADPAFTNRLEATLRSTMLAADAETNRTLFRPAVIVAALTVIATIGVFAISTNQTGEAATARPFEDATETATTTTTVTNTTTSTIVDTTVPPTTTEPPAPDSAPTTNTAPPPTDEASPPLTETTLPGEDIDPVDPTTAPDTAASSPNAPQPTDRDPTDPPAPTTPPPPTVRAEISRDGRVASITWTTTGDLAQVEGWVLVRTIDGSEETVEVSRDSATRSFEFPVTDLAATHRIEARAADGQVVTSSGSLTFTSDQ